MIEYYNRRVKLRRLNIGDLVLHRITPATKDSTQGKFGPTWEGPWSSTTQDKEALGIDGREEIATIMELRAFEEVSSLETNHCCNRKRNPLLKEIKQ